MKISKLNYDVSRASGSRNIIFRAIDIAIASAFRKYNILHQDVFSFKAFWFTVLASLFGRLRGKRIILNIHGGRFLEFFDKYARWIKLTLPGKATVISPSQRIVAGLQKRGILAQHLPNPLELDKFPYAWSPQSELRILWVRAFSKVYQPDLAVKVLAGLIDRGVEASLTMIGPDRGELENTRKLVEELSLGGIVNLPGVVDNNKLHEYYRSHSVFLNTTLYESFGMTTMEAASVGIPIVSNNVGELPFIWKESEEILFVEKCEPEAYINQILRLEKNKDLPSEISKRARKIAERYSWENLKPMWIHLLNES